MAGRRPEGVYSRPTLDYFFHKAGTGTTLEYTTLPNQFNYGGLYNNDNVGRKLYVLDITGSDLGSDFMLLYREKGFAGTKVMDAAPLDPTQPAPPGQIYKVGFAVIKANPIAIAQPQFVAAAAPPPGFRTVVPPGFTLWFGGSSASTTLSVTFTWVALPG